MRRAATILGATIALAPATARADDASSSPRVGPAARVMLLGAYRGIYDVHSAGGGVAFAFGLERPSFGVHFTLHGLETRSGAGLVLLDAGGDATLEKHFGAARLGVGVGAAYFAVRRETTNVFFGSVGPELVLGPLAYDFGKDEGAFVQADVRMQWQKEAFVWGPTVAVGWRF